MAERKTGQRSDQSAFDGAIADRVRALAALLGVSLLIGAPFVFWATRSALRVEVMPVQVMAMPVPTQPPLVPVLRESPDPLVVLVLDLSGSMATNDPQHHQLHAVRTALRIYQHMSRGVTSGAASPKLGVVLYSGSARAVSFHGEWWTAVRSEEDVAQVTDHLRRVLGEESGPGPDPRHGYNTDHRAAARKAGEVVSRYRSAGFKGAVCVLFMTDGEHDPSPLLDGGLTARQLRANREAFWARVLAAARRADPKKAPATVAGLRSDFEAWVARQAEPIPVETVAAPEDLFPVAAIRDRGTQRAFAGKKRWFEGAAAGLAKGGSGTGPWLETECRLGEGDFFRMVRLLGAGQTLPKQLTGSDVIAVSDPRDLETSFAEVLAAWLALQASDVRGAREVDVNPGARTLAVVARSDSGPADATLRGAGITHPIQNGLGLVADPEPGTCALEAGPGQRLVRAYADSHYRWVVSAPAGFSILDADPAVRVGLYRLDDRALAHPRDVYAAWPETVRSSIRYASGEKIDVPLRWSERDAQYVGTLPRPSRPRVGPVSIGAEVSDLKFANGQAAPVSRLAANTELREAVSVSMVYVPPAGSEQTVGGIDRLRSYRGTDMGTP